jgi:hypothetical protein
MQANIERIESGPSYMDKASEQYGDPLTDYVEQELREGFAAACDNGDANALCSWAPKTTDWEAAKRVPIDQRTTKHLPKRVQSLHEVLSESLDYGNGPTMCEAMQLILNVANGCDESTQQQARNLLTRMGEAYARANS